MARSIIGDLVWRVVGDTSSVDKSLNNTNKSVDSTGKSLKGLETLINGAVIASLVAMGKAAFDAGKKFDQGLGNVATLLNDPAESIVGLKESVKDLAIDTGLSLDALTDGLYQTVSAFGDTADATEQLELAARAARAGVATVTDSINLASAVTKAYGDTSADAQAKVFDLAFQTVKLGQTTFPELASSIQNVTDRSQALSVSQEELFAVMATLTGVTGNASVVSTQLKAALLALDSPTSQLSKLYGELGIESGKALIEQEGLQGAFKLIQADSEKTGVSLQEYLGRAEAVTAVSALATSQSETFALKLDEVTNSSGSLNAAFDIQNETLNGTGAAFDRLGQSIEVLKTTFFDFYSEDLANTFNGLTAIIELIGDLNTSSKNFTDNFNGVSKALELVNPVKAITAYNSLVLKTIGNWREVEGPTGKVEEFTEVYSGYLTSILPTQEAITEELEVQAEAAQEQTSELQKQIDLENERVSKVIETKDAITAAYQDELRQIEVKNSLGLLSEEEYNEKRLSAEKQLQDALIQLGYDGVAAQGERLQNGDTELQESLERRRELEDDSGQQYLDLLDNQENAHSATYDQALEDLDRYQAKTAQTAATMVNLANVGLGTLLSGFSDLGEALYNGELGWDSLAKVALNAVAAMLDAIGGQLAGLAALALVQSITGVNLGASLGVGPALAGSAAAYTTAGIIRGVAGSFEQGGIVPYPSGASPTGDNVLIRANPGEKVIPADEAGVGQYIFEFYLDTNMISREVVTNINKGRNRISLRGGTRA